MVSASDAFHREVASPGALVAPRWFHGEIVGAPSVGQVDVLVFGDAEPVVLSRVPFMPGLRPQPGHRVSVCAFGHEVCVTDVIGFNPSTFRPAEASDVPR